MVVVSIIDTGNMFLFSNAVNYLRIRVTVSQLLSKTCMSFAYWRASRRNRPQTLMSGFVRGRVTAVLPLRRMPWKQPLVIIGP